MTSPSFNNLVQVIKGAYPELTLLEWREIIRLARAADVLPRIAHIAMQQTQSDTLPEPVKSVFKSALRYIRLFHNQVEFEAQEVAKHIRRCCDSEVIFLKGSAYLLAGLSAGNGRQFSDIDILVDRSDLAKIEKHLRLFNWHTNTQDDYDEKYYREWAHEIPPIRHIKRGTVLDVHHNIIPPISGKAPIIELLTRERVPINNGVYVLSTPAMVLHSIVHLFYQEEFHHGFRDLSDLYLFFSDNQSNADFWRDLVALAMATEFEAELFLAYRYVNKIFGLDCELAALALREVKTPSLIRLVYLDWIFMRVLIPEHALSRISGRAVASFLALLRGHWLKMPLHVLLKHTFHKTQGGIRYLFTGDKHKTKSTSADQNAGL